MQLQGAGWSHGQDPSPYSQGVLCPGVLASAPSLEESKDGVSVNF